MSSGANTRPLIFGEVLFDAFADGHEVLGGAPFNVAWHLQGLGLEPLFMGRIGADERGERVRDRMHHWGLDVSAIQVDLVHDTGLVKATVENGSPSYEIVADRAWDFVDGDRALAETRLHPISMLYHGTLALRSERSRRALERLREALEAPVICDVNLREPWTPLDRAHASLAGAQIAKLNDSELSQLQGTSCEDEDSCIESARGLLERHGLDLVVVTRGEIGAVAVRGKRHWSIPAHQPEHVVDTVGAGDAFSAVLMLGLLRGWPLQSTLTRASRFAASVCEIQGATTDDPLLHTSHRERWESEAEGHDAK